MSIDLTAVQQGATNKFNKLTQSKLFCPALHKCIKFTYDGFCHLSHKDKKHKRTQQEQAMRFLCFLSVEEILKKSHLYQEYREDIEEIVCKKNGVDVKEKRMVAYYGFVAIVKVQVQLHRIRVVVKVVDGFESGEYLSVMPARKME